MNKEKKGPQLSCSIAGLFIYSYSLRLLETTTLSHISAIFRPYLGIVQVFLCVHIETWARSIPIRCLLRFPYDFYTWFLCSSHICLSIYAWLCIYIYIYVIKLYFSVGRAQMISSEIVKFIIKRWMLLHPFSYSLYRFVVFFFISTSFPTSTITFIMLRNALTLLCHCKYLYINLYICIHKAMLFYFQHLAANARSACLPATFVFFNLKSIVIFFHWLAIV